MTERGEKKVKSSGNNKLAIPLKKFIPILL